MEAIGYFCLGLGATYMLISIVHRRSSLEKYDFYPPLAPIEVIGTTLGRIAKHEEILQSGRPIIPPNKPIL